MCRHYQAAALGGAALAVYGAWYLDTHYSNGVDLALAVGIGIEVALVVAITVALVVAVRRLHSPGHVVQHTHQHPAHHHERAGPSWPHHPLRAAPAAPEQERGRGHAA